MNTPSKNLVLMARRPGGDWGCRSKLTDINIDLHCRFDYKKAQDLATRALTRWQGVEPNTEFKLEWE